MSQHRDAQVSQVLLSETRNHLDVMLLEPVALERLEILCQPEIRTANKTAKKMKTCC